LATRKGLYVIPAGTGSRPEAVSSGVIPNELLSIDPSAGDRVSVGYDHRWEGLQITINYNSGTDESFFFDLKDKGFWPQTFSTMPMAAVSFPKIQTDNNSAIVVFDDTAAHQFKRDPEGIETGETRDSYVWIPIPIAAIDDEGILHSIVAALAKDSADVNWAIHVGDTAEDAFNSTAAFTGTAWSYASGRYLNYRHFPRVRGAYAYIKVSDVSNNRWLLEQIVAEVVYAGGRRV
jgi:hypothetical protein